MTLPEALYKKYLDRFDELIEEGEEIQKVALHPKGIKIYDPAFQDLLAWIVNCVSLLDQVVPRNHPYYNKWISDFSVTQEHNDGSGMNTIACNRGLAYLIGIRSDLEAGILNNLALEIEAEISADYMGQAEKLLAEGQTGQYDHVPAAVLAGAVLEKGLRTLCTKQTPPLPLVDGKSSPLMMNRLIDDLKKVVQRHN